MFEWSAIVGCMSGRIGRDLSVVKYLHDSRALTIPKVISEVGTEVHYHGAASNCVEEGEKRWLIPKITNQHHSVICLP